MSPTEIPFEVPYPAVASDPTPLSTRCLTACSPRFWFCPRGSGFVPYADFAQAYEALKRHTQGFTRMEPLCVMEAIQQDALSLVVLRTILGFSPPELAFVAAERTDVRSIAELCPLD